MTYSVLQENVIPPSEVGSSIVILTQTLGEEFSYSTLGLRPRVEYENSSPRVWVRITILLPPSEGGMYQTSWGFNKLCNLNSFYSILPKLGQAIYWRPNRHYIFTQK